MATKTKKTAAVCKIKGCPKAAKNRGLCPCHHQSAYKKVQGGDTTWAELEKLGIADAPKVVSNGFAEFLAAKRAGAKPGKRTPAKKNKPKAKAKPPVVNDSGLGLPENSAQES